MTMKEPEDPITLIETVRVPVMLTIPDMGTIFHALSAMSPIIKNKDEAQRIEKVAEIIFDAFTNTLD